jgi:hypothetical protein
MVGKHRNVEVDMADPWIITIVATCAVLALLLVVRTMRSTSGDSGCSLLPEGREGELAVRLAKIVGCVPIQALAAVRQELNLAPSQSDDVILKRAAYHYRNAVPERRGAIYRDKVRG